MLKVYFFFLEFWFYYYNTVIFFTSLPFCPYSLSINIPPRSVSFLLHTLHRDFTVTYLAHYFNCINPRQSHFLNLSDIYFQICYFSIPQITLFVFIKTNVILLYVFSNYLQWCQTTLPDPHVSTKYPSMQVKSFDAINFLLSQTHLALFSSSIKTAPADSCSNKYWRNSSFSIPIFIVAFWLDLQWIFKYFICFQFSPSPCFLLIICTFFRLTFQTCKPF